MNDRPRDANTQTEQKSKSCLDALEVFKNLRPLRGDIRKNWNDTEKISMAPAQG